MATAREEQPTALRDHISLAGLVFGPGPAGRCDDFRVGGAVVARDEAAGLWRMWYYCRDRAYSRPAPATLGSGRIALAVSDDGIGWTRVDGPAECGAVFAPADDLGRFDCGHVGLTDITRRDGIWHMWYFGGNHVPAESGHQSIGTMPGLAMRCGLAVSRDGLHWQRPDDGRQQGAASSGALFELRGDELYAAWPTVIAQDAYYLLLYTAPTFGMTSMRTRAMRSADGRIWTEMLDPVLVGGACAHDAKGMVTRSIIANPVPGGRAWLMAYTGLDAQHGRTILLADSEDGLHWHRLFASPVLAPGDAAGWDAKGVAVTRIVARDGAVWMYYYGFRSLGDDNGPRGIGLATAPFDGLGRFDRYPGR